MPKTVKLVYFICETAFQMEYNNNLLYCNNCLYKQRNSDNNIAYMSIHSIIKKFLLNYYIILEDQILLID